MRLSRFNQLLSVLLLVASTVYASGPWWNEEWQCRREVTVDNYQPTGLPGDDIAVVTMPAPMMASDGRDIRVVDQDRHLVPSRVLQTGPGDLVTIAFALRGEGASYHVYFDNPEANWPDEVLEIERGILQESWRYAGGEFSTLAEAQAVLARATEQYGRQFRPSIYQGHNPFGPDESTASIYTAYIHVPTEGEYTFCISSQNASFLLVDDELLLSNGGRHSPQTDVSIQAATQLSPGLHRLRFYHISPSGYPVVVLAWQPPGTQRIWPMGFRDFTPIIRAIPQAMEQRGVVASIDFLPRHVGEAYFPDRYIQRYAFTALTSGDMGPGIEWEWSFGDGTSARGETVEHVYLAPGEYTVTLTATNRRGQPSRTQRVVVDRPWDRVVSTDIDPIDQYAAIVATVDLQQLDPANLGIAILLAQAMGDADMLREAGELYLAADVIPADTALNVITCYTDFLLTRARPEDACASAITVASRVDAPAVAAAIELRAGRIALDSLGQPDEAIRFFEGALARLETVSADDLRREIWRGIGDSRRVLGQYDEARAAYEQAQPAGAQRPGREAFEEGDYARHVEAYLDARDFAAADQYLDRWARRIPLAPLDGYWSLWVVRRYILAGDNIAAAAEADILLEINPTTPYGGELMMLEANAWYRLDDVDRYVETLRELIERYPESIHARQAAEVLAGD